MSKKIVKKREIASFMRAYEIMLILNPDLRESEVEKRLKDLVQTIEKSGGKITHEDFWGKRDLAYKINKYKQGIYMVYNVLMPSTFLAELKEHLRIEKDVVRSMILSLEKDYKYTKYNLEETVEKEKKFTSKRANAKPLKVAKKIVKKEEKDDLDKKLEGIIKSEDLNL